MGYSGSFIRHESNTDGNFFMKSHSSNFQLSYSKKKKAKCGENELQTRNTTLQTWRRNDM